MAFGDDIGIVGAGLFAWLTSVACLFLVVFLIYMVLSQPTGTPEMVNIAGAIQEGAAAFIQREYTVLSVFVVITGLLLLITGWETSFCFFSGAAISAFCGWLGMYVAVRSNVRTANAAREGLSEGLKVAFRSGAVMGLSVVSLGLLGLTTLYFAFDGNFQVLSGFGFGASSIALFARVGGGIFTKAADVGADLVGKVEAGIPEDDPRNPGVIADNVGDNVGDVAGMGADLFESYVGSLIAASSIGQATYPDSEKGVALPFCIAAGGIIASSISIFLVRTHEGADQESLLRSIRFGILSSSGIIFAFSVPIVWLTGHGFAQFLCIITGLVSGVLIGFATEYCTSFSYNPTLSIARSTSTGPATVIISGLGVGMISVGPPVIIVCACMMVCRSLSGMYGIAISAVGMLSTLGITLATDAYGPVADNAGGIAEMAGLPEIVRTRTDALDALGNTTAATGKGFAIGSAVVTSVALLATFTEHVGITTVDIVSDPMVVPGLLMGAMLPYIFAALTMMAVGVAAGTVIEEVRRQFHEIPGLLQACQADEDDGYEGGEKTGLTSGGGGSVASMNVKPDYATCVAICTSGSLKQMILPGVLAVVSPVIIGVVLGNKTLAGVLTGSIVGGFMVAVTMANAGGAWDNAKKYIEAGHHGGKGSEAHKAAVVGDTVGDPFKDTSGPALNILIKLMSIIAVVLGPVFSNEPLFGLLADKSS